MSQIDTVLSADGRINHSQKRSRDIDKIDATLKSRRDESAQVRNDAAAKIQQKAFSVGTKIGQDRPNLVTGSHILHGFARLDFDDFNRQIGLNPLQESLQTILVRVRID